MAISSDLLLDLATTTLDNLGKHKWTDLTTDLQEFIVLPKILKKGRASITSGTGISLNYMHKTNGNAKFVGLFNTDNYTVGDKMGTGRVPWRHGNHNYSWDVREDAMQVPVSEIVNLIKTRKVASHIDFAELMEAAFWGKPTDSTDKLTPWGIAMFMVYSASTGFNGGNPSGFSAGYGGIDSSLVKRWKNYTAQYTSVTKTDLIRKWKKACYETSFKAPIAVPDYNTGDNYGFYTTYDVLNTIEELLEAQNDKLGKDINSMGGVARFKGRPIQAVPYLDQNVSGDPIFGINWGTVKVQFLKGCYMQQEAPRKSPQQHKVIVVDVDTSFNYACFDRRKNFVLAKSDPWA